MDQTSRLFSTKLSSSPPECPSCRGYTWRRAHKLAPSEDEHAFAKVPPPPRRPSASRIGLSMDRLVLLVCGMGLGMLFGCLVLLGSSFKECRRQEVCSPSPVVLKPPEEFSQTVRVALKPPVAKGIFWTPMAENKAAISGFTTQQRDEWRRIVAGNPVVSLVEGCGRMQNRLATLADGSRACVRYRQNIDQIQGEVYSYHLANLLSIANVPPSVLSEVDPDAEQWSAVREQLTQAGWETGRLVVLTKYIPGLRHVYIPEELRSDSHTLSSHSLRNISDARLPLMLQWSDLMMLDYLTANMDRFVNSLVNLQWNKDIMSDPAHNLEQVDNTLVFFDNESGLFHGYRLLKKYGHLHENALQRLCIFRKPTLNSLTALPTSSSQRLDRLLHRHVRSNEPLAEKLPPMGKNTVNTLRNRMTTLLNHIKYCETQYR